MKSGNCIQLKRLNKMKNLKFKFIRKSELIIYAPNEEKAWDFLSDVIVNDKSIGKNDEFFLIEGGNENETI